MSRQFDVYRYPLKGRDQRPYLVVVQHMFFAERLSRVVAPLVVANAIKPEPRLNPRIEVLGKTYYFSPTEIFTIPLKSLRDCVDNVEAHRDRIVAALDLVFIGI